jgi:hypothetical protein
MYAKFIIKKKEKQTAKNIMMKEKMMKNLRSIN